MSVGSVARRDLAARMADAASALTATFDARQREAAVWPFPADDERRLWFYTPTDHGGVTLADLAPPQQRLALQLVASGLSRGRLRHRGHDHGPRERPRRGRGLDRHVPRPHPGPRPRPVLPPRVRRPGVGHVVVALRRPPRLDPPHRRRRRGALVHAELHGGGPGVARRSSARTRCGRWPAPRTWAGSSSVRSTTASGRRPSSLRWHRPTSSGATGLGCRDGDLPIPLKGIWRGGPGRRVHGPAGGHATTRRGGDRAAAGGPRGRAPHPRREPGQGSRRVGARRRPAGAAASAARASTWSRVPGRRSPTPKRRSTPATACCALRFAWAGGLEPGQPHYYRVQGPRLLVEYDNTQRGVNHAHAVWRDPDGDFGGDVLAEHHAAHHRA